MPLLIDYKALFVHIPKTGGRSIEAALLPAEVKYSSGSRSWPSRIAKYFLRKTASPIPSQFLLGSFDVTFASQHLTYQEIHSLQFALRYDLSNLYSFAICRNPYDRTISSVKHFSGRFSSFYKLSAESRARDFDRAIEFWLEEADCEDDHNMYAHRRPQSDFVCGVRGERDALSFTMRFEQLEDDFEKLKKDIGIASVSLPKVGAGFSSKTASGDCLTDFSKALIRRHFEKDFEVFDYSF